eukprot:2163979-Prorocentrum_lima.AAC.1
MAQIGLLFVFPLARDVRCGVQPEMDPIGIGEEERALLEGRVKRASEVAASSSTTPTTQWAP